MIEQQGVLAVTDVASIGAAQAAGFQMPNQRAVASARFGKGPDAMQERNQWHHGRHWRRVEITCATLKIGSLAHLLGRFPVDAGVQRAVLLVLPTQRAAVLVPPAKFSL